MLWESSTHKYKHLRLHEGYLILAHNNDSKLTPKTHLIKADTKIRKMRPGINERYQEDHLWTYQRQALSIVLNFLASAVKTEREVLEIGFQNPKGEKLSYNFSRKIVCNSTQVLVSLGLKLLACSFSVYLSTFRLFLGLKNPTQYNLSLCLLLDYFRTDNLVCVLSMSSFFFPFGPVVRLIDISFLTRISAKG